MLKSVFIVLLFVFITINVKSQIHPEYCNWLFIQSDKALQYRIAVVKQEGSVATLQFQFRVNNEDEVYCKSSMCNGMLLSLRNKNVGDEETTQYSFIFEKSFIGLDNIYTWPQLLTAELKTWPDGSKRYWSLTKGIVYTVPGDETEHNADIPYCCVDVRLTANPNNHRCETHGFDTQNAIIVK